MISDAPAGARAPVRGPRADVDTTRRRCGILLCSPQMKLLCLIVGFAALLCGCATTATDQALSNTDVIAKYLGGHFQVMGPVDETRITKADFESADKVRAIQSRSEGADIYFVFEPADHMRTADQGRREFPILHESLMLVLRDGTVVASYPKKSWANQPVQTTPTAATPPAGAEAAPAPSVSNH